MLLLFIVVSLYADFYGDMGIGVGYKDDTKQHHDDFPASHVSLVSDGRVGVKFSENSRGYWGITSEVHVADWVSLFIAPSMIWYISPTFQVSAAVGPLYNININDYEPISTAMDLSMAYDTGGVEGTLWGVKWFKSFAEPQSNSFLFFVKYRLSKKP